MTKSRKLLFGIYLFVTVLIAIGDQRFHGTDAMIYIKYATMGSLLLIVQVCHKQYQEQKRLAMAYWFMIIADFFLVFSNTLDLKGDFGPFGMAAFLVAYMIMISVYRKHIEFGKIQIIIGILIYGSFALLLISLIHEIHGIMLVFAMIFGIALSTMAWMSICILFGKSFSRVSRIYIALSGLLMFVSDFGVALNMFHPIYSTSYSPALIHFIWITYIPAWTILGSVVIGKDLFAE